VLQEGQAVAGAMGLTLEVSAEQRLANIVKPTPGSSAGHKPSMLQDFELGRPTELDAIVLAVQDFARELGIPTPNLDAVAALAVGRAKALGIYPK
jgi:2-dehydropantoate 2-reductase